MTGDLRLHGYAFPDVAMSREPVEVYRERAYAGSILLRGYVLGIQLRGDVLVALSEEMDDIIAGERWLDWYEVVARS